jgi:acylphosphatase
MSNTQVHVFISGTVQGVGFRQFVKHNARKLGITGWVRNLTDGRVEAILQGEQQQIERLIALCEKGPFLAEVGDISITREPIKETYEGFSLVETGRL